MYEKQLIAAMNNPNTLAAWRVAQNEELNHAYWKASARRWQALTDINADKSDRFLSKAVASHNTATSFIAQNEALNEDLAAARQTIDEHLQAHERLTFALLDKTAEARDAIRFAFKLGLFTFLVFALQAIGAWGYVLQMG